MPKIRTRVTKPFITESLRNLQRQLRDAATVTGKIEVDGHPYWWFLEYGTGQFHEDSSAPPPGMQRPSSIKSGDGIGLAYPIEAKTRPFMVFESPAGEVHFFKKGIAVVHPGIHPVRPGGFVRRALFNAQRGIKKDLDALLRDDTWWTAREKRGELRHLIVDIINTRLQEAVEAIEADTPVSDRTTDTNPSGEFGHLRQSWRVVPAK